MVDSGPLKLPPGGGTGGGAGAARDEFDELEDARDAEDAEDLDDSDDPRVAGRRCLHVPPGKAFLRIHSKRRTRRSMFVHVLRVTISWCCLRMETC